MHRLYRIQVPALLLVLWLSPGMLCTELAGKKMRTTILSEGSVPPGRMMLACIHDLDNKSYSELLIKDCVGKLSANYFVRNVKVHTQESNDGWVNLEFILTGDPLTVEKFVIETFDKQEPNIWKLLALSADNLHPGGMYSWETEAVTYESIRQFYRSQGRLVAIVPKVNLDYKEKKAFVYFKVLQGPVTLAHPLVPPYGKACGDHTSHISWSETEDGVPVELVETGLALSSAFTCFSNELAERDKVYLSELTILSDPTVYYSGPMGDRRIEYKLKAKPLKVERISLRGFGDAPSNLEDSDSSLVKNLSLKTGSLFSHSAATESANYLRKTLVKDGYWADVTLQEELCSASGLQVTFSVLLYPLQTIIVDGNAIK